MIDKLIDCNQPIFITFEGGEGSGKSTQSKMLYEYLLSENIKAIYTREIGGTAEAEKIRDLVVHSALIPMSELMLIMAARCEHISKVIIPALLNGHWVICDRFIDSTACYQSEESGLSIDDIYALHKTLMTASYHNAAKKIRSPQIDMHAYNRYRGIMPDLTFLMNITPEIGLQRAKKRGDINKFEEKNIEFHQKVYACFNTVLMKHPERFMQVESVDKTIEEVHKDILKKIFG